MPAYTHHLSAEELALKSVGKILHIMSFYNLTLQNFKLFKTFVTYLM